MVELVNSICLFFPPVREDLDSKEICFDFETVLHMQLWDASAVLLVYLLCTKLGGGWPRRHWGHIAAGIAAAMVVAEVRGQVALNAAQNIIGA